MHHLKSAIALSLLIGLSTPARAEAQQSDGWTFSLVPMYFWAMGLDGTMSAGPVTLPITLEFSDAVDHLGGAFSFHLEAARGKWGVFTDLNFLKLSSEASFAVGPQAGLLVDGDFELNNVMFEAGAIYFVGPTRKLGILGGVRTYTIRPTIRFSGPAGGATPVDGSETSTDGIVGFVFRPRFNEKWALISRADIGAGTADLTWSAVAGLEFRFKPWGSLDLGYKALGIDVDPSGDTIGRYDVTHSGPIFGFRAHWGGK